MGNNWGGGDKAHKVLLSFILSFCRMPGSRAKKAKSSVPIFMHRVSQNRRILAVTENKPWSWDPSAWFPRWKGEKAVRRNLDLRLETDPPFYLTMLHPSFPQDLWFSGKDLCWFWTSALESEVYLTFLHPLSAWPRFQALELEVNASIFLSIPMGSLLPPAKEPGA